MTTLLKLGPADKGRPLTLDDFLAAEYAPGHKYELIDGRLDVSPLPNPPAKILECWIFSKLYLYTRSHPEVVNFASLGVRVFVPGRPELTAPEPDAVVFKDFPLDIDYREIHWQDCGPLIVVEVISEDDPDKDFVRNAELYLQVPSIKEYWVVEIRPNPNHPSLIVHRRSRKHWRLIRVNPGETYTTNLLPGFELVIDPRR